MWKRAVLVLVMSVLMVQGMVRADEEVPPTLQTPKNTVESLSIVALLQRVEELEERIATLEAARMSEWTQWRDSELRITAYHNCEEALSEKLVKTSLKAFYSPDLVNVLMGTGQESTLTMYVDTKTQPTWNVHLGLGRFSVSDREVRLAYQEAADYVFEAMVEPSLPITFTHPWESEEPTDVIFVIHFTIQGYAVGTWTNGTMKLEGE